MISCVPQGSCQTSILWADYRHPESFELKCPLRIARQEYIFSFEPGITDHAVRVGYRFMHPVRWSEVASLQSQLICRWPSASVCFAVVCDARLKRNDES